MSKHVAIVNTLFLAAAGLALFGCSMAGEPTAKPHMMYFYNPSCRLCTKTNEVVGAAEEKYKDAMSHQRLNIADPNVGTDNVLYMFDLLDELQVPEGDSITLVVFLGLIGEEDGEAFFTPVRVLVEGEDIIEKLDGEIADFLSNEGKGGTTLGMLHRPASFFSSTALAATPPAETPADTIAGAGEDARAGGAAPVSRPKIRPRASGDAAAPGGRARAESQLRFWTISAAALADSINPCAFATVIILVAMMSSAKRSKNEIIAVCLAFTASVYLTYFAIGLFLYRIIAEINSRGGWYLYAADIVYYIAFALCAIFAFLSLRDAYMIFRGKAAEEMTLQLPKAFKKRINLTMAKGVRARWLVAGVFVAGVSVSFLEAACTGQVYLPTILIMAESGFWKSMFLLAWYNLLFVMPLLIVFGLVLLGVTSQQLADFFRKNIAWTKVALGLVFIIMGVWIYTEMYWPPGYRG